MHNFLFGIRKLQLGKPPAHYRCYLVLPNAWTPDTALPLGPCSETRLRARIKLYGSFPSDLIVLWGLSRSLALRHCFATNIAEVGACFHGQSPLYLQWRRQGTPHRSSITERPMGLPYLARRGRVGLPTTSNFLIRRLTTRDGDSSMSTDGIHGTTFRRMSKSKSGLRALRTSTTWDFQLY